MEQSVTDLIKIAQNLDESGFEDLSIRLDSIADSLSDIKVAQYVGAQGYWIRNTRCWTNCYRQKRASFPGKAAQEVWGECHSEYLASINNDGSKWDKYAETEEGIVKIASQKSIIDEKLAKLISEKVEKGASTGQSVFESLNELQDSYDSEDIKIATRLFDFSAELFDKNPQEAIKVAHIAEGFVKESQLWRGLGGALKNMGQGAVENVQYFSYIKDIESRAKRMSGMIEGLNQSVSNAQNYFNTTQAQNPATIQKFEAAKQVLNQVSQETMQVDSVLKNINRNVVNVLQGVSQQNTSNFMGQGQQSAPQQAAPQQGGVPSNISMPGQPAQGQMYPAQQSNVPSNISMPGQPAQGQMYPNTAPNAGNGNVSVPNQNFGPQTTFGPGQNKPRRRAQLPNNRGTGYISPESGSNREVKKGKIANNVAYNRSKAFGTTIEESK